MKSDNYQVAIEKFNQKKFDEARNILKNILTKNPKDYDAYNFVGIIELSEKKYQNALKNFLQVLQLKKDHPNVWYNIGLSYQSLGIYDKAITAYEEYLNYNQKNVDALNNLGLLNVVAEDYQRAEEFYQRAIKIEPANVKVLLNYSNLLLAKERFEDVIVLNKYVGSELDSNKFSNELFLFKINVAKSYFKQQRIEDSLNLFLQLHKHDVTNPEINLNLANVYLYLYENEKAKSHFEQIIGSRLEAAGYNGLGLLQVRDMNFEKAIHYFNEALKKEPENVEIHYNLSHALLINGDLEKGFVEYEFRKNRTDFLKREFSKQELTTEDIYGKRILVWDEQGIGDIIQFVRYLKLLKQRGAIVIFQCAEGVVNLIENLDYIDKLIPRKHNEEPEIEYDFHISLLSLPKYFQTNLKTIPIESKYIYAKPALTEHWKKYFQNFDGRKIGIVWAGNPKHTNDKNRSIRLKYFEKLFDLKNFYFFSLQKGYGLDQAKEYENKLIILDRQINSLSDTAAIIENLDLVISVDTSVAHLSAALGKETFLMLPFSPDWRWLTNINYSPWYPSMKIFRQEKAGNWENVFDNIKSVLSKNFSLKEQLPKSDDKEKIFLGLTSGENFGWGICSKYLKKELSKKKLAESLEEYYSVDEEKVIEGKIFHALTSIEFKSIYKIRGRKNYGYTFFENELTSTSVENSKKYDLVIGGSTWCKEKMEAKGINNTEVLLQGIDPDLFYPINQTTNENLFVIFSGGKFELRKGQDLVLKAVKYMQNKYPNVILINAWYNFWPNSIVTMANSQHIKFEIYNGSWNDFMNNIYKINGLDAHKIFTLPITPNEKLRELYAKTDIGLFPNRCEGGTNLVMMEYMACGKPVIASYNTGHIDVLTENNSIQLKNMKSFQLQNNGVLYADWFEPEFDEIIYKLEFAYHNRDKLKEIGKNAGKFMQNFTWSKTAEELIKIMMD